MNAKTLYRNVIRLVVLTALVGVAPSSCEAIKDDMDGCGIYLEFIYDYNMEFADSFDPQVPTVDVFVFDWTGKFLFTRHSARGELIGGKRMLLADDLQQGEYQILTVGGLTDSFSVSDAVAGPLVRGVTSLDEVRIALVRSSSLVSAEFPSLWVGGVTTVNYRADLTVWPVHLVKDTNHFDLVLADADGKATGSPGEAAYTFEIVTPEGAEYDPHNGPLTRETVTYTPYYLEPGVEAGELSVARLNTVRLLDGDEYAYKIIVRSTQTGKIIWEYDLMVLLKHLKPDTRPEGTLLPMQEFLDRRSSWHIAVLCRDKGGTEGLLAVAVKINDWILWLNEVGV